MKKQSTPNKRQLSTIGRLLRLSLFMILFPALFFSSCISDSTDDCESGVFLRFSYVLNRHFTCLFSEQVDDLTLYIYHEATGELFKTLQVNRTELSDGNRLHLDLPAGSYRVNTWGNLNTDYYADTDIDNYDSYRLSALCEDNGQITSTIGSLFHGSCRLQLKQFNNTEQPVEMMKNTNLIHVVIRKHAGMIPSPAIFERYNFGMSGSNGCYDIDNRNVSTSSLHYPAECMVSPRIEAAFTVLRLAENDDLTLKVSSALTGEVFDEVPVVQDLMMHPHLNTNEDLDRYDEYLLHYELSETDNLILVGVNDWDVSSSGGGI